MTVNVDTTGHSDQIMHDDHISDSMEIVELKHHSEGKDFSELFCLYFLILFIL